MASIHFCENVMSRARARLFANGGSQAVRLPKEFRLNAKEVEVWRVGDEIRLRPVPTRQMWQEIFDKIDAAYKGEFPDRNQPTAFEREALTQEEAGNVADGGKASS